MTVDSDCVTLYPERWKSIRIALLSLVLMAFGLRVAQSVPWLGYLCVAFFALGIPLAVLQQLPGSCYLRITHEEMSYCHFFRRTAIPWQDIDRFEVVTLEQNGKTCLKLVGIHFVANSHRETFNRHLTQVMARCDGGLPDTYGMDADELVSMLNACHSRFTGGSATLQS